jgi:hypothetical protein
MTLLRLTGLFFLATHTAHAQESFVPDDEINDRLAGKRDYVLERNCRTICEIPGYMDGGTCMPLGGPASPNDGSTQKTIRDPSVTGVFQPDRKACCETREVCEEVKGKLSLSAEPLLLRSNVEFADTFIKGSPSFAGSSKIVYKNCTEYPQKVADELKVSTERSDTVSVERKVKNKQAGKLEISYKFLGLGTKNGYEVSREVEVGEKNSSTVKEKVERTAKIEPTAAPLKTLTTEGVVFQENGVVEFDYNVTFEGPLIGNAEGVTHLSDVLSVAERTFTIKGELEAVAVSSIYIESYEEDADCENATDALIREVSD